MVSPIPIVKITLNAVPEGRLATPSFWKVGGYFTTPHEIRNGKLKISFLGNASEVKAFLRLVQRWKIPYRVVHLTDARFSPNSPMGRLTDKQRKVLMTAFNLGYYDVPRRKAERRVLAEVMEEA